MARRIVKVKNGKYVIYKNKEYSADYIKGKGIVLRSYNAEDLDNGFQKYDGYNKEVVGIKFVEETEVTEFYRARTVAIHKGYEFEVVEEKNNEISIVAMTGDYRVWEEMGMKCIDKGVYQKWITKDEAEIKIIKENLLKA